MEKRTAKRTQASKKSAKKQKKIIIAITAFVVIGVAALAAYSLSINSIIKEWDDKIYPGITIQDTDVGGMTKEEAKNKLAERFGTAIDNKKLHMTIGDKQYELIYSDITPKYDIDGTVEEAYKFGKESGIFNKYMTIKDSNSKKNKILLGFSYDEEKLKIYEENLYKNVMESSKDAKISIEKGKISVKPGIEGKTINLNTLDLKLKENINGDLNSESEVTIDLEMTKPRITKEDLSKINGVMGSFSSSYGTSAAGRSNNIDVATASINGTVVMPGEIFSFNDVVGPRTIERGFQEAGTYVGNKVEPGIGGGICQVSTAIYRAAMKANLRSVERTNHSMIVGYAQPGLDATVSYDYLDYKFKNTYDFPLYIQGITAGKVMTYNIYGDPSALGGKTYDMVNEVLETIPPETKVVLDSSLIEGKEVSEGLGMTGYRAKAYQITYEKGKEVNREVISTDSYASVGILVKKGTQPTTAASSTITDAAIPPTIPATASMLPPQIANPAQ